MKRRFPLQIHISTIFLVLLLLVGGILGGIGYGLARQILGETAHDLTHRIHREILGKFSSLVAPAGVAVHLLGRDNLVDEPGFENKQRGLPFMQALLDSSPAMTSIYIGYADGGFFMLRRLSDNEDRGIFQAPPGTRYVVQQIGRSGDHGVGRYLYLDAGLQQIGEEPLSDSASRYDPRQRGWFRQAASSAEQIVTEPYLFFSTGRTGLTVARQSMTPGVVAGADIRLETLNKLLSSQRVTAGSRLAVVDAAGRVVATDHDIALPPTIGVANEKVELPTLEAASFPLVRHLRSSLSHAPGDQEVASVRDDHGRKWHTAVRPLVIEGGTPLFFVAAIPDDELMAEAERLLRYLQEPGLMTVRYSDDAQASRFAAQAYAALVLARQQKAPLGALREIWSRHDQARSGLPLLQLGIALKTMGDAPRGDAALKLAVATPRQDEKRWLGDYGSPLRDDALKLALLEENRLLPEVQNTLLSTLSEEAYGQRWLSTQETNALFLAGRTLADLPGSWQAQTSLQAEPLTGDKAQTRNLDGDRLAALQVSNTGSQPLWLRLDSSGYPQSAPQPGGNVLGIERTIFDTQGQQKSLSSLRSGELVLVKLEVTAKRNVPDALVVDLLPAGLELENQNLANSSASLQENGDAVQNLLNQMQQADIQHIEFRDDRFVAAVAVNEGQPVTLVYLARAVTPGTYQVPQPQVESMYAPQWRATGAASGPLTVTP